QVILVISTLSYLSLTRLSTLSLHDALPIYLDWYRLSIHYQMTALLKYRQAGAYWCLSCPCIRAFCLVLDHSYRRHEWLIYLYQRSEEHTSELQSRFDLVCRLLLEKKNICHD